MVQHSFPRSDSVAIVTGAGSFIGMETVRRLLDNGVHVLACDMESHVGYIRDSFPTGSALTVLPGDVSDEAYLTHVVDTAGRDHGGVDFLVTAAASFADTGIAGTRDEWLSIMDINVIAPARLITLCAPHMRTRGGGSIVIVSSISGRRSQPGRVLYPTTKAALLGLSRNAAQALAADGIRVNSVLPGITWSRNIEMRYGSRQRAEQFAGHIQTLGRMADPAEIADAVVFLLSEQASFITGAELAVDGGYLAASPEANGHAQASVPALWSPPVGPGPIYTYERSHNQRDEGTALAS